MKMTSPETAPVSAPADKRQEIADTVGQTMENLEKVGGEVELREHKEKQEKLKSRFEKIEKRVKKVCPDEFAGAESKPDKKGKK